MAFTSGNESNIITNPIIPNLRESLAFLIFSSSPAAMVYKIAAYTMAQTASNDPARIIWLASWITLSRAPPLILKSFESVLSVVTTPVGRQGFNISPIDLDESVRSLSFTEQGAGGPTNSSFHVAKTILHPHNHTVIKLHTTIEINFFIFFKKKSRKRYELLHMRVVL